MSSIRFPGKVLALLDGTPLIKHLINRANDVENINKVVVITSTEDSDDSLVAFLDSINFPVFRGELGNVFERFQKALDQYPCDYFVRLCADSPYIDAELISTMIRKGVEEDVDLISNVYTRTFPKGQSVEILKYEVFKNVSSMQLSDLEREHVTPYFYKIKDNYSCLFFELREALNDINQCIDYPEDLKNVEQVRNKYVFDESKLCILKS